MALFDIIGITFVAIRGAYKLAVAIRDSESINAELKQVAMHMTNELNIVGGTLDQLQHFAHRATVQDEFLLVKNINELKSIIDDAQNILQDVIRDRSFFARLLMKNDVYRQQLREISNRLHNICHTVEGAIPAMTKIVIPCRDLSDFRKTFRDVPDKILSLHDFSFIKNTSNTVVPITIEETDTTKCSFYMKLDNQQIILSYQLRTWSALNPKLIVLDQRRQRFQELWRVKKKLEHPGSSPSIVLNSSTKSLPDLTIAQPQPSTAVATDNIPEKLDFSEFFMSHDDICGMALTRSFIYIATKYEITIISLDRQEIVAQFGTEGNGPNKFKHISCLYIPRNDETNLYIVDRGQYCVQLYKIDSKGLHFEFIRQYVIIANVPQRYNLVSCVIFNENLFVSDDANHCLHIFSLKADRQSFYFLDSSIRPVSPELLCVHGKYLYVSVRASESLGVVVFNEKCEIVDWFRNSTLKEVLAMDIDVDINELYIITTIQDKNDERKKRPLIVSMDIVVRPQQ
ncbi:unnamed protein product [Rotaria sp. Silwood1]|nr:unnamed protein product [Rotaria sp. Silwood1]CAF4741328.1 unnamed protein product [Rotaria sp. Silwood1]